MKINLLITILLFSSTLIAQQKDTKKEAVRKAYNDYKTAALNDQGERAYSLIDQRTVDYYEQLAQRVKVIDSTALEERTLSDKLQILLIRSLATAEQIQAFDGKSLFVFSVDRGLIGKNSTSAHLIGEVIIEGNFAKGEVLNNGQPSNFYFHFYKEKEQWKFNLTALFPPTELIFKRMQRQSGLSEHEFLFSLIEAISQKRANNSLWNP